MTNENEDNSVVKQEMKLWLLEPVENLETSGLEDPWEPWYDKVFGIIVAAYTEEQARHLAQKTGGNEVRELKGIRPWLDIRYSTCIELSARKYIVPEVILKDTWEA